ncbi:MAG: 4Fe-4S dicluster domain-containing protein [Gammaproteobacteria bacterium]|nr:4Fe-4S dicluster domain-containing protein [Gammaproteobacteria bacterium]
MTTPGYLAREHLDRLFAALRADGYRCVGPGVQDGAIQYRELPDLPDYSGAQTLPSGWRDTQEPGCYRLEHTATPRQFAWANGPQALKPFLFAPRETLWRVERNVDGRLVFKPVEAAETRPLAVIGVRACDVAALRLQDAHFLDNTYRDPQYAARREGLFLVAVNCTHPAATCFCVSTGDGPALSDNDTTCDLILDELDAGFAVKSASARGEAIAAKLDLRPLDAVETSSIAEQRAHARTQQRALPSRDLRPLFEGRLDHPRWAEVAARCLACGNCTSVCPTCFCHSDHDLPAIDNSGSAHYREWDSCFTQGHSYIHGITLRADTRLRYRQWLTHKLGTWHDQYGRSGCVGCGRCIGWCPVGIDITEEVAALAADAP